MLSLYRLYTRSAIQASVRTADTVVVNSEWTADIVESLFSVKPDEVIYPNVPVTSYSSDRRQPDSEDFYLYLGVLDSLHRVEELVEVFDRTSRRLKVAGEGPLRESLEQRAGENVEFCGYVTGDRKRDLLANCEALVNPTNHSFGRAMIECLASGRPVVSLSKGYAPYLIEDCENGVLYRDGSLSKALARFEAEADSWDPEYIESTVAKYAESEVTKRWRALLYDQ